MSKEHLRTGDKALVRFRFMKNPEYMRINTRLVFREGRTKAVGSVTKLFPNALPPLSAGQQQRSQQKQMQQKAGEKSKSRRRCAYENQSVHQADSNQECEIVVSDIKQLVVDGAECTVVKKDVLIDEKKSLQSDVSEKLLKHNDKNGMQNKYQ